MDMRKKPLGPRPRPKRVGRACRRPEALRESKPEPLRKAGGYYVPSTGNTRSISATLTPLNWRIFQEIRDQMGLSTTSALNLLLDPIIKNVHETSPNFHPKRKKKLADRLDFWYAVSLDPADHPHLRSKRR